MSNDNPHNAVSNKVWFSAQHLCSNLQPIYQEILNIDSENQAGFPTSTNYR